MQGRRALQLWHFFLANSALFVFPQSLASSGQRSLFLHCTTAGQERYCRYVLDETVPVGLATTWLLAVPLLWIDGRDAKIPSPAQSRVDVPWLKILAGAFPSWNPN